MDATTEEVTMMFLSFGGGKILDHGDFVEGSRSFFF
jgi:hypothetical protein